MIRPFAMVSETGRVITIQYRILIARSHQSSWLSYMIPACLSSHQGVVYNESEILLKMIRFAPHLLFGLVGLKHRWLADRLTSDADPAINGPEGAPLQQIKVPVAPAVTAERPRREVSVTAIRPRQTSAKTENPSSLDTRICGWCFSSFVVLARSMIDGCIVPELCSLACLNLVAGWAFRACPPFIVLGVYNCIPGDRGGRGNASSSSPYESCRWVSKPLNFRKDIKGLSILGRGNTSLKHLWIIHSTSP
ncbi:uncharacterized protein BDR25DRAFT_23859 [Lindgomyces ingoldianus]|uniref:Uncharacterized protein n=1 Tax=Lindgomyces ingoldianus TaxID=673940 RepID=A0ACB6QXW0_9PLEO|nr:uncharacterized protein BDR25DRAFT_23859 [Lindgomyces ingoldianus]KAF2471858.1 hypothetical protein BDR25DRAFT_23859 [Lindgomyces ingoldianus]